jgi:hypothetical protein
MPAVALLIDRMPEVSPTWRRSTWTALAIMGLVIFDIVGKRLYYAYMGLSLVSLCALFIVVALVHLRRAKLA